MTSGYELNDVERSIVLRAAECRFLHIKRLSCACGEAIFDSGGETVIGDENIYDYSKNKQSLLALMGLTGKGFFRDYRNDGETYELTEKGQELAKKIKDEGTKTA